MTPTVAIIAPGNMGSGVGQRLTEHKVKVLTSLAGRSEASAKRARAGRHGRGSRRAIDGMRFPALDRAAGRRARPGETAGRRARRRRQQARLRRMQRGRPAHACSKSPRWWAPPAARSSPPASSARRPKPGTTNTKFYASGPAAEFARLNDYGLIVRVLQGPLTAASALKMSYAGITKGFTALGAAMMLAATRDGSAEALKSRARRKPARPARLSEPQLPDMYAKAYRWVAELDEIADFVGKDHPEHAMLDRRRPALRAHRRGCRGGEKRSRRDG